MLASTYLDSRVFRVGYAPEPLAWVPWPYVDRSTGRWDDPGNTYRVLYTGASPEACFVEVLAQFRPDPLLAAEVGMIAADPRDPLFPATTAGVVPSSWLGHRLLGSARLTGRFVDVTHRDSIAHLRDAFLARAVHFGLPDFDAAAIRLHEPRRLTQEISRYLYESDEGSAGISYESRFGADLKLFAVFERGADSGTEHSHLLTDVAAEPIASDHPALEAALRLHGLVLGRESP